MAGRPLGQVNRFTRIREDFLEAFYDNRIGGVEGLVKWASENSLNRQLFYKMIVQLLPKELNLTGADGGPIQLTDPERITRIQYVIGALERLAKEKAIPQIEPETIPIEAESREIPTEQRPPKDRIGKLIDFNKKIESLREAV
jgi:hypothetical protein